MTGAWWIVERTNFQRAKIQASPWSSRLGRQLLTRRIPPNLLKPGRYSVSITEPRGNYYQPQDNILTFQVTEPNSVAARDDRGGKIAPRLQWS